MFGIKLWSQFAVFRDPLTVTQNLSFPIPPKTTIGGMLAAILGIDYSEYFADEEFFEFGYSLVLQKPVRKRSFAQNYVADYTKESETKHSSMGNLSNAFTKIDKLTEEKENLERKSELNESEKKKLRTLEKKLEKENSDITKKLQTAEDKLKAKFVKPKPIFREILLSPEYLVFIKGFKYNEKALEYLKKHYSEFQFYMGNSEFAANYQFVDCSETPGELEKLDSFTAHPENIFFESGKKYTNIFAATKAVNNREYREYKNLVFSDSELKLKKQVKGSIVTSTLGDFHCEFV